MESVNFIFKFIPSYIKNLLEIVVKLKIKKCLPKRHWSYFMFDCVCLSGRQREKAIQILKRPYCAYSTVKT